MACVLSCWQGWLLNFTRYCLYCCLNSKIYLDVGLLLLKLLLEIEKSCKFTVSFLQSSLLLTSILVSNEPNLCYLPFVSIMNNGSIMLCLQASLYGQRYYNWRNCCSEEDKNGK